MSKWINFVKQEKAPERKTDIFNIETKDPNRFIIGKIQWYPAWRCYSFMPSPNCVFETQCLKDITVFIDNLMLQRKILKQQS